MPSVSIGRRGEDRVRAGHPWIYRSDVTAASAAAGDLVEVRGARDRVVAHALFSDRSEITLRIVSIGSESLPSTFLRDRLKAAIDYRASLGLDATAYRLVHGEADRVDRKSVV